MKRFGFFKTFLLIVVLSLNCPLTCFANVVLTEENFFYEGAFRVPQGNLGGDSTAHHSMSWGGGALTYNPVNNSLIAIGRAIDERNAIEFSIPQPLRTENISDLNVASVIQPPGNIGNGQWSNLAEDGSVVSNGSSPGGLLVYNGRLIASSYAYYDAGLAAARSHFTVSLDWAASGVNFKGMFKVGFPIYGQVNGGWVGGYMAHIPSDWQTALGGPVLTGLGGVAIMSRSSYGPSAWVFDPDDLGNSDPAPATVLVGYPETHTTLGTYNGTSLFFNMTTVVRGLIFPSGSDSVIFFGKHGLGFTGRGDGCYGYGTADRSLHGTTDAHGVEYCYDPVDLEKGTHAYPYVVQAWFYDAKDLLAVKSGSKQYWEVTPYAVWNPVLDHAVGTNDIVGAAYDPTTQSVFLAQPNADNLSSQYSPYPLIHVFKIVFSSSSNLTPPQDLRKD